MKRLTKIVTGIFTFAGGLYWGALPTLALGLCPEAVPGGTDFSALCNTKWTPEVIITTGINILLFIAFVAALGFLIFGGIRWILSGGDKEGTAKAKSTITSALIGLVVVQACWIILNVVLRFFGLGDVTKFTLPLLPK